MHTHHRLTPGEALYLAIQMEQNAISLYERGLMVFAQGAMKPVLRELLEEERAHKAGFERLLATQPAVSPERRQALDEEAGGLLFEGGLSGAVREGAFDSVFSLLRFAAHEEERAAARYHQLAKQNEGAVREAFLLIAQQEEIHLACLLEKARQEAEAADE